MATSDKIASALQNARKIADGYQAHIIPSDELTRQDREVLVRTHWLQEITKGWYMLTRPDLAVGDSAAWYVNFWDFLRIYLHKKYGMNYCLSAETSLELHTGNTIIPQQLIAIVAKGGTLLSLPHDTSILTYADPDNMPKEKVELNGLQIMSLPYALCKVTPSYFRDNPENAEIALRSIREVGDLSRVIIENNFQRGAERVVGAYEAIGLSDYVRHITTTLSSVGLKISPKNPFTSAQSQDRKKTFHSPYSARIYSLWENYRHVIVDSFPSSSGLPKNHHHYLTVVDELYEYDAYNSLSIEGYHVTPELIHRVLNNHWNPDLYSQDSQQRDALAARGYYDAFQALRETLVKILKGEAPGKCVAEDLQVWYQQLFSPCVNAGILSMADLLGYRRDRVYIRNSRHVPPPKEALLDCMEAFFDCMQQEESAAVRAVLGHYIFVFIHPYMDGNGRIARFILNTMLASGGYPWTIVQVKHRKKYIDSLEATHIENNIKKFTHFILEEMKESEAHLRK